MYDHPPESLAKHLTDRALIAFCTAAIDRVAARAQTPAVTELLLDLWAWQAHNAPPPPSDPLPSSALYDRHAAALLEQASHHHGQSPTYETLGAAYELLLVILSWMDAMEYRSTPDRTTGVAPADVVEADWGTLADGLRWACRAAENGEAEFAWQKATFARLKAEQPRTLPGQQTPDLDGRPLQRVWFFPPPA